MMAEFSLLRFVRQSRSVRERPPAPTFRPVLPCTLNGCRIMELALPPIKTLGLPCQASRARPPDLESKVRVGMRTNRLAPPVAERSLRALTRKTGCMTLPGYGRREAEFFLKRSTEAGRILEPKLFGDSINGKRNFFRQFGSCSKQTLALDIRPHPSHRLEQPIKS